MNLIEGIGGAFLFSPEPERLAHWYRDILGFALAEGEGTARYEVFWGIDPEEPTRRMDTVFSIMQAKIELPSYAPEGEEPTDMYGDQPFMLNVRTRDIDKLVEHLESKGVEPIGREDHDYGRFTWVRDPDGNRVEVYQPVRKGYGADPA
jgi:catechol 2,3-dioxygenase-like lactoylglutathione lyase family enzyme